MRLPKVILAKIGLDGHDVGLLLVASKLRDAGFEVVYLGKRNAPAQVVEAAIDEDAGAIGVSSLSGGLGQLATEIVDLLKAQRIDIPVLAGGIDEPAEIAEMLEAGVLEYFGPGTATDRILKGFRRATSGD